MHLWIKELSWINFVHDLPLLPPQVHGLLEGPVGDLATVFKQMALPVLYPSVHGFSPV